MNNIVVASPVKGLVESLVNNTAANLLVEPEANGNMSIMTSSGRWSGTKVFMDSLNPETVVIGIAPIEIETRGTIKQIVTSDDGTLNTMWVFEEEEIEKICKGDEEILMMLLDLLYRCYTEVGGEKNLMAVMEQLSKQESVADVLMNISQMTRKDIRSIFATDIEEVLETYRSLVV